MASIHPRAGIGNRNSFGYGVRIGPNVSIGDDNHIGNYVLISGNVTIGNGNVIGIGSVLGGISNHVIRKKIENTPVNSQQAIRIGDENIFGEFITVHTSVGSITSIGNHINVGTKSHVAHDANIEDRAIISIHCGLGGYVRILRGANVGIGVNIHPRIVVGQYSMIGLGSVVIRHIQPGATVVGNPQRYIKPNRIGMERNGLSTRCIEELSQYLNGEQVDLAALSSETHDILSRFFDIIRNNKYVRDVPCVPSHGTSI